MSIIIAVLNQKGGVGKTTLATNLAAVFGKLGKRTIVVDITPQQSAKQWAKQARQQQEQVTLTGQFNLSADIYAVPLIKGAKRFKLNLNQLIKRLQPELVLLDCPANHVDENLVAALIAQVVLMPITPSPLDAWSGEAAMQIIKDARSIQQSERPYALAVVNKQQKYQGGIRVDELLQEQKIPLADTGVSWHLGFMQAVQAGQTMVDYAPRSSAVRELTALAKQLQGIIQDCHDE